jgi:hypothetical protein
MVASTKKVRSNSKKLNKSANSKVDGNGKVRGNEMVASTKKMGSNNSVSGKVNGNGNGNGKVRGNGVLINGANGNSKGMELIAKTMYRELKDSGYDLGQILDFSGKLISFVHDDISTHPNK